MGEVIRAAAAAGNNIRPDGGLPSFKVGEVASGVNGGGFSGTRSFEIPYGEDENGNKVELTAICSVSLSVDDWGSVQVGGVGKGMPMGAMLDIWHI